MQLLLENYITKLIEFFLCVLVYVLMYKYTCRCMHIYVEVKGQYWESFSKLTTIVFEKGSFYDCDNLAGQQI